MNNNPTFTSHIKVVSPAFFNSKVAAMCERGLCTNINTWNIIPGKSETNRIGNEVLKSAFSTNMERGYTKGVRSCTSMLVANKGHNASVFEHIRNSLYNLANLPLLEKFINGTNAIIIGSKNMFPHSKEVFQAMQKQAADKRLPTTILQGLKNDWEAHVAYNSIEDTLYLAVNQIQNPLEYIMENTGLKRIFKQVKISPTDDIEFITSAKEAIIKTPGKEKIIA